MNERPPYRLPKGIRPLHYVLVFRPDFSRARFDGEAAIDLEVDGPATEVVLNALDLEIRDAHLSLGGANSVAATVAYRPEEEQAALVLDEPLGPGRCRLELAFSGKLNDLLKGFYRSKFRDDDGRERWVALTQFEPTDARRAFPCWDEPEWKATFGITVEADEGLTVLSNAREVSSGPAGAGKRRTRFADTMKMSTYLVAMVIGPFGLTDAKDVDGVPVRIGYVPSRAGLTGLAEQAAAHALHFLSGYFSIPYPADKLD
ncbi:MAG: M1 family metallopeptidase, partial [Acidimicrobiales bacterium]